jgi:xanthine dehydrogenase YagR molybdenum-binding subunit
VLVGVAPAIANAVFHATRRRVRDFPIIAEALP